MNMDLSDMTQCDVIDDDDKRTYDDDESDRVSRFVETSENPEVFKSKSLNKLKPFYNGSTLDNRMAEIRQSINYIRQHWDEYDVFLENLKQLLLEYGGTEFKDKRTREHFDILLSTKRDWLTKEQVGDTELGFEAVRLYTSKEGHGRIYRLSNDIFRKETLVSIETIRSVVFLVELINIDLYNYCLKFPEQTNFEGEVYRGICLTEDDLTAFKTLRDQPIGARNIAIPLGLLSASSSLEVARKFIEHQLKHPPAEGKPSLPLIIKIHVISLKQEFVEHYTHRFPQTVLTTICAVDIQKLSRHRNEKEVLLRGPFMLVLDFYQDENISVMGQACNVLEAVMLNANRDHITTSLLGSQEAVARDMFAAMVTVTRSEWSMKFCKNKGLVEDEKAYGSILEESERKVQELMKQ